jgi:flagellar biosynthesis component FlhA
MPSACFSPSCHCPLARFLRLVLAYILSKGKKKKKKNKKKTKKSQKKKKKGNRKQKEKACN